MEDFFQKEPRTVGVILDIENGSFLETVKNGLIAFARTLQFSTEDKIYVYTPGFTQIRRWMGECVADVANYSPTKFDPRAAVECTLDAILPEPYTKTVLYISDRIDTRKSSRITQGLRRDRRNECGFHLLDFTAVKGFPVISPQLFEDMTNGHDRV